MVVVGDSIPFGGHFCPGCASFVDQYAGTLEERLGARVSVKNRSRDDGAGLPELVDQVTSEDVLRGQLGTADLVLVSIGANNALPDYGSRPAGGSATGCYEHLAPGIADEELALLAGLTPACSKAIALAWAPSFDTIFGTIAELRAGRPTALLWLNIPDGNLNNPNIKPNVDAKTFEKIELAIVANYDSWNAVGCERAQAHGFICVDVYHAMNGSDGSQPFGDLSIDGAHPSQKGNDVIAKLLADVDVSVVSPPPSDQ